MMTARALSATGWREADGRDGGRGVGRAVGNAGGSRRLAGAAFGGGSGGAGAKGAQHVLDLGCGVGRHALLFAEHGFAVEAIDDATAGLEFARREAAARGLRLSLRQGDADVLPFVEESFDYLLSWNVIF